MHFSSFLIIGRILRAIINNHLTHLAIFSWDISELLSWLWIFSARPFAAVWLAIVVIRWTPAMRRNQFNTFDWNCDPMSTGTIIGIPKLEAHLSRKVFGRNIIYRTGSWPYSGPINYFKYVGKTVRLSSTKSTWICLFASLQSKHLRILLSWDFK